MCIGGHLTAPTGLQIAGDYVVGLGGTAVFMRLVRNRCVRRAFYVSLVVFAPIEYVQPRLGWVHYRACRTEWWLPESTTWFLHSLWDALIVGCLFLVLVRAYGPRALCFRDHRAPALLGACGMAQEVALEVFQGLWTYTPTRWNPCWAVIGGRDMTLQQWHWAVIPGMVYLFLVREAVLGHEPRAAGLRTKHRR